MDSRYLTADELTDLTGRRIGYAQAKWLRDHRWPFEVGADGRPRVLRLYHDQRMMGLAAKAATKSKPEPNWSKTA